jgi:hypothetical protein
MSGEMSGNVNRDDKDCHNAQVCDTASSLGTSIREAGSNVFAHLKLCLIYMVIKGTDDHC